VGEGTEISIMIPVDKSLIKEQEVEEE